MSSDNLSPIFKHQPFFKTAKLYLKNGWLPIPLKVEGKNPASDGYTGKKNPYPGEPPKDPNGKPGPALTRRQQGQAKVDFVKKFKSDPKVDSGANVGIWLAEDIIGIDVDNYADKDGKSKDGWQQLKNLESSDGANLGELPPTWVSTARNDGKSGIRFYRIPKGLSWSGKAASNIDIIQRGHRFAVVAPSVHPDTKSQYAWYTPDEWDKCVKRESNTGLGTINPGLVDDENGKSKVVGMPNTADLPWLPDKWVEFLTRGYMAATEKSIDMDSTWDEVQDWYTKHTRQESMCRQMEKRLATALDRIGAESASHDPLIAGQFSIIMAGVEGHSGSEEAIKAMDEAWIQSVKDRDKRTPSELKLELFRSMSGAMRIAKARITELQESGADTLRSHCTCIDLSDIEGIQDTELSSIISLVPHVAGEDGPGTSDDDSEGTGNGDKKLVRDPNEYRMNDDGNAEFLFDLTGRDNLKWVRVIKRFILWNGREWQMDDEGHTLARMVFQRVRDRQEVYANSLRNHFEANQEAIAELQAELGKASGPEFASVKAEEKEIKAKAREWLLWAKSSGNAPNVRRALEAYPATSRESAIDFSMLDADRTLLGMQNGVLELNEDGVLFRKARFDDFVTLSTGQHYYSGGMAELIKGSRSNRSGSKSGKNGRSDGKGDFAHAHKMWEGYLDLVLPDHGLREFVQRAFGAAMGGPGKERLMYFLYGPSSTGKSTLLRAIKDSLGGYASPINLNIFKNSKLNPALGEAMDKRIVVTSEVSSATGMDEGVMKQVTGGDYISVEYKNSNDTKDGVFKATVAIATNVPPRIVDADSALHRRLCVMPFNEVFAEDDPDFYQKFMNSGGATVVLHWLVDGYLAYCKTGLSRKTWPERVVSASDSFGFDMNDIGEFINATLVRVAFIGKDIASRAESCLGYDAVFKEYNRWCNDQRIAEQDRMSLNKFNRQLRGLGYRDGVHRIQEDSKPERVWEGVQFLGEPGPVVKFKGVGGRGA